MAKKQPLPTMWSGSGGVVEISKMEDDHLANAVEWIKKKILAATYYRPYLKAFRKEQARRKVKK